MTSRQHSLLAVDSLNQLSFGMLGPIYAIYVNKIGGSIFETSLSMAIFAGLAAVSVLTVSRIIDQKRNKATYLSFGYFLQGLVYLSYLFVVNIGQLIVVQALAGFAVAFINPVYDGLFSSSLVKGKETSGWANWYAVMQVSAAIGMVIGGLLATKFGFSSMFIAMTIVSFISSLFVLRFVK